MKKLSCQEIRETWINFFTKKCPRVHKYIPSASLVPDNPTLLLNSAGMVQFVPIFMGTKPAPEPPRAVTIQKCARVGGKDSDLENIGRTTRHHSFFEMLGNFSFGDYFKAEAIEWAWTFVREELEMPAEALYISVFKGDEQNARDTEAYDIWMKVLEKDFPDVEKRKQRIWEMSRKDNFWGPPGKSGPCGPCSEIYFDVGEHITKNLFEKLPDARLASSEDTELTETSMSSPRNERNAADGTLRIGSNHDDRFIEIWNLVFMQFNKDEDGIFTPLAKQNIDTGAGLERIATILQGVNNSFETDELFNTLTKIAASVNVKYGANKDTDLYLKIITDHLRCLSFLIADGVRPSNLGRGYVLRMIIRRAARFVYLLREEAGAFLYSHTASIVENYSQAYPELKKNAELIQDVCKKEEEAFTKTIINGLKRLESVIEVPGSGILSGEFVFDLYATYGFPLELTLDIAQEKGFSIDIEAYEVAKAKHSEISNTGAFDTSVESSTYIADVIKAHGATVFLGYDTLQAKAKILAIEGNKLVLDRTPFYAESGGQLADLGVIVKASTSHKVTNVKKVEGVFVHHLEDVQGLNIGDEVEAIVDPQHRKLTTYHHTACHLLQAALRKVLGTQVQQMGSQVGAEYTRFDFNADKAMSAEEIKAVEDMMNQWISHKLPVTTKVMNMDDAVKAGALSFFEEKYDDEVRVLCIADDQETASVELCGGTHVANIGDIGRVVIAQEGSVAAGIRRIKMFANQAATEFIKEREETEKRIASEKLAAEQAKATAKARTQELTKLALAKVDEILTQAEINSETKILIVNLANYFPDGLEAEIVKTLVEALMSKIESAGSKGFVLLAAEWEAKLTFIAAASADLVKDPASPYNASNAVKAAAQLCGGGGGGRPNFAQAGGKDATKVGEAIGLIREKLVGVRLG